MGFTLTILLLCTGLFIGMLVMLELGRRYGVRRLAVHPTSAQAGTSVVDGTLAAFLGLLIAFTFSNAVTQYEGRRTLIINEANAISSAYQRIDILPASEQPHIRQLFRDYTDKRLELYQTFRNIQTAKVFHAESVEIQNEIWRSTVRVLNEKNAASFAPIIIIPAFQAVFDISEVHLDAFEVHPPVIVYVMLFCLALINSALLGIGMAASKSISWFHTIGFAFILSASIFIIIDIEYPRVGLIQMADIDIQLEAARANMN